MGGRVLDGALADEHLPSDAHRRHVGHSRLRRECGRAGKLLLHRAQLGSFEHRGRVHLAGRRGDQRRSRGPRASVRRRTPGGRPPARTAPCARSTWRTSRRASPARCRTGTGRPLQRLQTLRARGALDLRAEDLLLGAAAIGLECLRIGQLAREHRLPLGRTRQHVQDALGREIGERACQVEVEGGVRVVGHCAETSARASTVNQPAVGGPSRLHHGL